MTLCPASPGDHLLPHPCASYPGRPAFLSDRLDLPNLAHMCTPQLHRVVFDFNRDPLLLNTSNALSQFVRTNSNGLIRYREMKLNEI